MNSKKIINELHQFATPVISDALDTLGWNGGLSGILPINAGKKITGPAYTISYELVEEGQAGKAGDYIDEVPEGSVIVISNKGHTFCTVWGGILTYLAQLRKITGVVIDGCCRDVDEIKSLDFPVYTKSVYMKSGKNRVYLAAKQKPVIIESTIVNPNDIVCADESGVLVVPLELAEAVVNCAREIIEMEEKVMKDLQKGISLKEARINHNYNKFAFQPK